MGDEPIWAKVSSSAFAPYITRSSGHGSARFDKNGKDIPYIAGGNATDGKWTVIGWITSGGYGHYVDLSLAQGYIPSSLCNQKEDVLFEIEILGNRCPAKLLREPPFDPTGQIMRS
jgi:dimethylglycine dehydrogenase